MKTATSHKWSENDDIVAFYLYKFPDGGLGLSLDEIGKRLNIGTSSLKMRLANFRSLDGGIGLDHPSKRSQEIYRRYQAMPQEDLKRLVLSIVSN